MKHLSLLIGFLFITQYSWSQCDEPQEPFETDSITTWNYAFVGLNYSSVSGAHNYKIQFRELGAATWQWRLPELDTTPVYGFAHNTCYEWRVRTTCDSVTNSVSSFSVIDTFCTGAFTPEAFSPSFNIELSHYICDSLSDMYFSVSQDPNEPDVSSFSVFSDVGSFAINTLTVGQVIGEAYSEVGGGYQEFFHTLEIDNIISNDEAVIAMRNDSTNLIDGSFTIENDAGGIKIVNNLPPDGNFYTTGNISEVTLYDIFLNPPPGSLEFLSSIIDDFGMMDNQVIDTTIACLEDVAEFVTADIFFPNPTEGMIHIDRQDVKAFSVYAVSGQMQLEGDLSAQQLDLSSLSAGVYILELQAENARYRSKLLLR
jgi:hypothetical protein